MNTFNIAGVSLLIIADDGVLSGYGVPEWMPAACVDTCSDSCFDGEVRVTPGFLTLSKEHQNALLTHEAAHVACGHLIAHPQKGEVVVDERLEAEADAWAIARVGYETFKDACYGICSVITSKMGNQYSHLVRGEVEDRLAKATAFAKK